MFSTWVCLISIVTRKCHYKGCSFWFATLRLHPTSLLLTARWTMLGKLSLSSFRRDWRRLYSDAGDLFFCTSEVSWCCGGILSNAAYNNKKASGHSCCNMAAKRAHYMWAYHSCQTEECTVLKCVCFNAWLRMRIFASATVNDRWHIHALQNHSRIYNYTLLLSRSLYNTYNKQSDLSSLGAQHKLCSCMQCLRPQHCMQRLHTLPERYRLTSQHTCCWMGLCLWDSRCHHVDFYFDFLLICYWVVEMKNMWASSLYRTCVPNFRFGHFVVSEYSHAQQ